jgi:hypothetical protein
MYAEAIGRGSTPENALRSVANCWRTHDGGEATDAANALVWGADAELADLVAAGLPALATAVWEPVRRAGLVSRR